MHDATLAGSSADHLAHADRLARADHLAHASDASLLQALDAIVGSHRRVTAELVLCLGEVDARRLHVERGFPSLFAYCVEHLRFSEDEACRRIEAARLVRRFPSMGPLLESGAVSLTVLGLLKHHLTDENANELLAGVSGSKVRSAKEWIAARFPAPDVAASIRKLPASNIVAHAAFRTGARAAATSASAESTQTATRMATSASVATVTPGGPARARAEGDAVVAHQLPAPTRVSSHDSHMARPLTASPARAHIEPLSRDRFLVKFTASRSLRDKLEQARDWMRHANPDGDLSVVVERAVDLLLAELAKKQQGATTAPRRQRSAQAARVTRAARREVVARDGWRCSFVAADGRRCDATTFLELDHEIPRGQGGGSDAENLRVLCRAHNRLAAEHVYGRARVAEAISRRRKVDAARSSAIHGTGSRPP